MCSSDLFPSHDRGGGGGEVDPEVLQNYLRKDIQDYASEKITFRKGWQTGVNYAPGPTGFGGIMDANGNAEFDSLKLRKSLEVPELAYNRVKINIGDTWAATGGGVIETVDTVTKTITLKLEEGEIGAIAAVIVTGKQKQLRETTANTGDSEDKKRVWRSDGRR